jgi:glucose/arabinose dehydrogenase
MVNHLKIPLSLMMVWLLVSCQATSDIPQTSTSPGNNWGVAENLKLEEFASGFQFPTSIAFVDNPGENPSDPLFFVAELFGAIKVVTNDGGVHLFADNFFPTHSERSFTTTSDQYGLAGLCLSSATGYLFASYVYVNSDNGLLYNGMTRFENEGKSLSSSYDSKTNFDHLFSDFPTSPSHQIGNCFVEQDSLFVGIGDGELPHLAQDLDTAYGKILRMDLDGKALAQNPFFSDNNQEEISDFVWAYGLRNPFAITSVEQRVFSVDNGLNIDRFIEIFAGENYLWDGTDLSIGSKTISVFSPAIGPVQLHHSLSNDANLPPELRNKFFVSASASQSAGIFTFDYSLASNDLADVPEYVIRYREEGKQLIAAMAVGPDGLYFAPLLDSKGGTVSVYRLTYSPGQSHIYGVDSIVEPLQIMKEKNCWACHSLRENEGDIGPRLDFDALSTRLSERLRSADYLSQLASIDTLADEPYFSFRQARNEIRNSEGSKRLETWMVYHLLEPRFDNPRAQMPNLGLTQIQAEAITTYLLTEPERKSLAEVLSEFFQDYILDASHIAAFGGGALLIYLLSTRKNFGSTGEKK